MEDNNVASTPQLSVSRSQGAAEEVLDEHDYLTYLNQVPTGSSRESVI